MKILITGATGTIGSKLIPALENEHDLVLLSRRKIQDDARWRQVDVTKIEQVMDAMRGCETVIHLAIASGQEGDYEGDDFNEQRFEINVKGTYNVFEAARRTEVKRVIYTSSLTVVWGYLPPTFVEGDAPAKPVGTYALTKHLGEQIAEHYAKVHGLSVLCMRIPKPVDIEDKTSKATPILPQWIAFPDLVQAYLLALKLQNNFFETITLVGESSRRRWDISKAEQLLGYQPQHRLEDMGYTLRDEPQSYTGPNIVRPD